MIDADSLRAVLAVLIRRHGTADSSGTYSLRITDEDLIRAEDRATLSVWRLPERQEYRLEVAGLDKSPDKRQGTGQDLGTQDRPPLTVSPLTWGSALPDPEVHGHRPIEDVPLPPMLSHCGPCSTCGTSMAACFDPDSPRVCCGRCEHPDLLTMPPGVEETPACGPCPRCGGSGCDH